MRNWEGRHPQKGEASLPEPAGPCAPPKITINSALCAGALQAGGKGLLSSGIGQRHAQQISSGRRTYLLSPLSA